MLTNLEINNIKYIHKAVAFCDSNNPKKTQILNATKLAMINIAYKIHEEMYKPQIIAKSLEKKIEILEDTGFCPEIIEPVIQSYKVSKKKKTEPCDNTALKAAMSLYEFCLPNYYNAFCLYFNKYRFPKQMQGIVYTFLNSIGEFCVLKTAMLARNMLCYYLNYLLQGEITSRDIMGNITTISENEQIVILKVCNVPEALTFICDEIRCIANDLLHRPQNEILGNGRKRYIRLVNMALALICVMPFNRDDECISNINNLIGVDQSENYEMKNTSELIDIVIRLDDAIYEYKSDIDKRSLAIEATELIGKGLVLSERTPYIPEWDNSIVPSVAAAVRYLMEDICISSIVNRSQSIDSVRGWLQSPSSDSSSISLINNAGLTATNCSAWHILRSNFINENAHKRIDNSKEKDWEALHKIACLIRFALVRDECPRINYMNEKGHQMPSNYMIKQAEEKYLIQLANRYQKLQTSELKYNVTAYKESVYKSNKGEGYVPGRIFGIVCIILLSVIGCFIIIGGIGMSKSVAYSYNGSFHPMVLFPFIFVLIGLYSCIWLIRMTYTIFEKD